MHDPNAPRRMTKTRAAGFMKYLTPVLLYPTLAASLYILYADPDWSVSGINVALALLICACLLFISDLYRHVEEIRKQIGL